MLAKLDPKHLDTLARINLRTGSTDIDTHSIGMRFGIDIDTHSIGTRFGTDIDTHSLAYEKVGYNFAGLTGAPGPEFTAPTEREREKDDRPLWLMLLPCAVLDRTPGSTGQVA